MADVEEKAPSEIEKREDEVELDVGKCAAEFAQYCQVDVKNEVSYPLMTQFVKYLKEIIMVSLKLCDKREFGSYHICIDLFLV